MAKYNYDKSALKGLGVGPFLGEVKNRNAKIEAAPDTPSNSWFNPNELGKRLHPAVQHCVISKVADHGDAKSFTLVPDESKGTTEMAYFRAGQYTSVLLNIGDARLSKPYTIRSDPKDALGKENTRYTLTIKETPSGYASKYILENWKEGSEVTITGPLGDFYYQGLRDAKQVVAIAGGSGITPFYSMAAAIASGIEDFNLTILYGSRTADNILLKEELDAICAACPKVKVVHVLSGEEKAGYEHGFIDAGLIKKYAPDGDYSLFLCGPKAMYAFAAGEIEKLGLPKRRWRMELSGDITDGESHPDFPADKKGKEYKMVVNIRGKKQTIPCKSNQTLLVALEQAGIPAPSHCRSGECGWCHSLLVSGEVFTPKENDGRRLADKKFGWIHPCCSFPLSDLEIEVPVIGK